MAMSMMVNDTPVLVLLLPIMAALAANGGMPASKTLIPVNSAVLIGGMATTIGTSTNLLVVSIASDMGLPPMGVFHFTPIVMMAALVALPFIWLVMPRLLPDNSPEAVGEPRRFYATLRLGGASKKLDRPVSALEAMLPDDLEFTAAPDERLAPGGRVGVTGTHQALEEAMRVLGATAAPAWLMDRLKSGLRAHRRGSGGGRAGDRRPIPAMIGKSVATCGVAEGYNVAILGIHFARRRPEERPRAASRFRVRRGRHPPGHRRDARSSAPRAHRRICSCSRARRRCPGP